MTQKRLQSETLRVTLEGVTVCCRLDGVVTGAVVEETMRRTRELATQVRQEHGQLARLFLDVSEVKKTDSKARSLAKELADLGLERVAVYGRNRLIMSIGQYIARSAKMDRYTRFFTSLAEAKVWLETGVLSTVNRPLASGISGLIMISIGVLGLIGWQFDISLLKQFLTDQRPINPMACVGLLIVGLGFVAYWRGWHRLQKLSGTLAIILGVAALLPFQIDYLLYGDRVTAAGNHTVLADTAAVCFIINGLLAFLSLRHSPRVRRLEYGLLTVALIIILVNIYAQLYARDWIYGLGGSTVMAFNLALAFFIGAISVTIVGIGRSVGSVLGLASRITWLIVPALITMQGLTYAAWSQTIHRNDVEARQSFEAQVTILSGQLNDHIRAYSDALAGYQGLYRSSTTVTRADFQSYFDTLHLSERYPGLRTIIYVKKASTTDLPGLIAQQRADQTLVLPDNQPFTITQLAEGNTHYVVTFNATNAEGIGLDLADTPGRLEVYDKALATGQPASSGSQQLTATASTPAQAGFFVAVPVVLESQVSANSVVVAVFNYQDFFPKVFNNNSLRGLDVHISDGTNNVFTAGNATGCGLRAAVTVPVDDHALYVTAEASHVFGLSSAQQQTPAATLVVGQLFSGLLVIIFISQSRSRGRAVKLAEAITRDLHNERDSAVAVQKKDDAILASIGDAVFAIDTKLRITLFNPAAEQISGFSRSEAMGRDYREVLQFIREAGDQAHDTFIARALKGHVTSMKNHTLLVQKHGHRIAVADSAAPIRDAGGKISGVIVVFRDVSKELQLDKAKSEFVSLASHQLRTPLSAINWYAEMLLHGDAGKLTAEQHDYLTEIYDGNNRMIDLVNSLLDVSKLDLGRFTNQPVLQNIAEVVESVEKEFRPEIGRKRLTLNTEVVAKLPPISIDPKLLRMVIQNLLSNAVKYTASGGSVGLKVHLATSDEQRHGRTGQTQYLWLEVRDTGCGIPTAQQGKVFSKLFRADNVQGLEVDGTGLGLYIVKQVAERLGGAVWFESVQNEGSVFRMILPTVTRPSKANDSNDRIVT